jgi:hypothetical protein
VIAITGAEGVITGIGPEAVAIICHECMSREKLDAIAERGLMAVGEESLDEGRRDAGVVGRDGSPGVVVRVANKSGILLPEEEWHVSRG